MRHLRLAPPLLLACALVLCTPVLGASYSCRPSPDARAFESLANRLQPGDELIVYGGTYLAPGRRAITVKGTSDRPSVIRAADGEAPILTAPAANNCLEVVDCSWLRIHGLKFQGGNSGVRFIRGDHITFEDCEISQTGNNALTMNSGDCHAFTVRRNHIHHTGLNTTRPTEGEGMYIGCHDGSCRTTDSIFENNYIHHLRGTSDGGNDGIEIKTGSFGNLVRNNVIHDTNIERQYPGIFVYGGGPGTNLVEGNVIWNAGEGIQVVSDAAIENNIIFNCVASGITAAPHSAMPEVRNVLIVNNTIFNAPIGVRMRWARSSHAIFANNAIYCPDGVAFKGDPGSAVLRSNCIRAAQAGVALDDLQFVAGRDSQQTFIAAASADFWPAAGSILIGKAAPEFAPAVDFNGRKRAGAIDVGAYQSGGDPRNPGWSIAPGFKR